MPILGAMTFRRYGRSHHLRIRSADDLRHAAALDEAHWVATGAPIATISCDPVFLDLVDTDDNGRIMCAEVTEAIEWLSRVLSDRRGVTERSDSLSLEAIDASDEQGARIRGSARKILDRLGEADSGQITLEQVRQIKATVEGTPVSEAGVVLPEAGGDEEVRQFLADVVAAVGGAPHPSGKLGVGAEQFEAFLEAAAAAVVWYERGRIPPGARTTDVMPLGDRTPEAHGALAAVRAKIDQYFAQCEALALDERFAQQMGWTDEELAELDFDDPTVIETVLAGAPLARGRADRQLRFDDRINPHYVEAAGRFRELVVTAVLGEPVEAMSAAQWRQIKSAFAAHHEWLSDRPPEAVEALGAEKLAAYLEPRFAEAARALIAESARTAFVLDNIRLVEKLVLYQSLMIDFANNFISFPHLYDPDSRAMFEMGTLVMDGRRFNFAVRVDDRKRHQQIARTSNMCLLYVEVAPRDGGAKYEVAVPVTSGGIGNLCPGKRGIFDDVANRQCDAMVVGIIENPISLAEAIVSPFRRLARLLTGKIESLTTQAEKKLDARAAAAVGQITAGPKQPAKAPPPAPAASGPSGGMLMGLGVASAAIGSALAYITKTLAETHPVAILVGILAAVLLVMLPTSIVAWLKLRKRDLSAILEGAGWAVNARMRLTRRQSRFFARRPSYPVTARGVHRVPWGTILVIALLLGALIGAGAGVQCYMARNNTSTSQPVSK